MAKKTAEEPKNSKDEGWIVLVGGGSGGHVLPLRSIAKGILEEGKKNKVLIITDRKYFERAVASFKDLSDQHQGKVVIKKISSGKFRRYSRSKIRELLDIKIQLLNIRDIFKIALGFLQAKIILLSYKPAVIFCKGGNSALEFCLAARKKAPIIVHDSDSRPGIANRVVGRYAEVFLRGMPNSADADAVNAMTGIPVDAKFKPIKHEAAKKLRAELELDPNAPTLFVTGGGLGAQKINELILTIIADLNKLGVQVLHQTGRDEATNEAKEVRKKLNQPKIYRPFTFSANMASLYGASDIVLGRAGATTIQELANSSKASIIIPAHLSDQKKNAKILDELGASVVLDQNALLAKPEELTSSIQFLLSDEKFRSSIERAIGELARPDVSDKIVETLLKLKK
jgi:UDP-N-acetylglucosamine--N-acetylmuramyl-(pentapeptide) pyrophosphoryl-undecaprenol N-acetylglucosamine transferase